NFPTLIADSDAMATIEQWTGKKKSGRETHQERRKFSWRLFMDVTGSMSEKLQAISAQHLK
ncbi:MAG TPA: hypothetical protein VI585_29035, partial [Candidatus Binatia bacterium]